DLAAGKGGRGKYGERRRGQEKLSCICHKILLSGFYSRRDFVTLSLGFVDDGQRGRGLGVRHLDVLDIGGVFDAAHDDLGFGLVGTGGGGGRNGDGGCGQRCRRDRAHREGV